MKYTVTLQGVATVCRFLEVDAASEDEAKKLALAQDAAAADDAGLWTLLEACGVDGVDAVDAVVPKEVQAVETWTCRRCGCIHDHLPPNASYWLDDGKETLEGWQCQSCGEWNAVGPKPTLEGGAPPMEAAADG